MTLSVVIVGAGLSGLSASISLSLVGGHTCTILESTSSLTEVGAGLQLTPNCSRILDRFGLLPVLKPLAAEPSALTILRYSDGKVLAEDRRFGARMLENYGAPFWDLHRADLLQALANRADELGVKVKLGRRVTGVDFAAGKVSTKGVDEVEEVFEADLIVSADGLWSVCRAAFLGRQDEPLPTGDLAYRIKLSLDQIDDLELREMVRNPEVRIWIGPRAHAIGYSLRGGKEFNIVLLIPDNLKSGERRVAGNVNEMRMRFNGWDPVLTRLLGCVSSVEKWKLMHRPEMESWVHSAGKFVMIGDACHPMLPYLAQGANSGIEDGAALGALLKGVDKTDLFGRLKLYQLLRKKRGEAIAKETFAQRRDFHLEDGKEQRERDLIFEKELGKEVPEVKFPSRWTCPVVQPWLYGHDVFAEVDEALSDPEKLKAGTRAPVRTATQEAVVSSR